MQQSQGARLTKVAADSDKLTLSCHEIAVPFIFDVSGLSSRLSQALKANTIAESTLISYSI
jgi:hypothetical protein